MAGDIGRAGSAVLNGRAPLALADDFWFTAHDTPNGGLQMHVQARDHGLAACLLGELWLAGLAGVEEGAVTAVDRRPVAPLDLNTRPVPTSLVDEIWGQVVCEPWRHSIRTWLTVLAETAEQRVIKRLAAAGYLHVQRSRRGERVEPLSRNTAGVPTARLRTYLERRRQLSTQDLALLTLLEATGLSTAVFDGESAEVHEYRVWLLDGVTQQFPPLGDLAVQTRLALAAATLTRGHG